MRLLSKREADARRNTDLAQQVTEGRKLANSVDRLRELQATEEASLEKFRVKTLERIGNEIREKTEERDTLIGVVSNLKKEREELLKPLNEEWDKVSLAKAEVEVLEEEAKEVAEGNKEAQKQLETTQKELEERLTNAKTHEEQAELARQDAEKRRAEAEQARTDALREKQSAKEEADEARQEFAEREQGIIKKEQDLKKREARIKERELAIEKEWGLVQDRRAMVERIITRYNK